MRIFKFGRSSVPENAQYGKLYEFLKDIFTTDNNFRRYEQIDWSIFGSRSGIKKCNDLINNLTIEERHAFMKENTTVLPDDRLKELMPLFHLLAKIQCSEEMLIEIRGDEIV